MGFVLQPGQWKWCFCLAREKCTNTLKAPYVVAGMQKCHELAQCALRLSSSHRAAVARVCAVQTWQAVLSPACHIHSNAVQVNAKMVKLMSEARTSLAGELDGKFPSALRNVLFGAFGEDLFTRNAFRSHEVGMQPYASLAKCFGLTPDPKVRVQSAAFGPVTLLDAPPPAPREHLPK
jgi:hypothetical protein